MTKQFDSEEAKKYLLAQEQQKKQKCEEERKKLLQTIITLLKRELEGKAIEVYLIGSIIRPFAFSLHSDIDIVLKNYHGDRFDLWAKLEREIERKVEIIPFETCHFQEFVIKEGFKVI